MLIKLAYKQAQNRKKHLRKTYNQTKTKYCSGVWYDEERGYYYKYYASNTPGYTKRLRKISNKRVRRLQDPGHHSSYKRAYDYKWILF